MLIPAGNPSLWTGATGNNTYLLTGAVRALVDAGTGQPEHVAAVARAIHPAPLDVLLLTHGHRDHASGVPALTRRFPLLRVRNHGEDACSDGERIAAGDTVLVAIHTPGHAPDHCCFFDERNGDLFCGDLLRQDGTVVIPASDGGDLVAYLASLRRIRALAPARLLPGHGPVVDEPVRLIDGYLRHREGREAQILEALRMAPAGPDTIARRVYGPLPEVIAPAAADTVLAHLRKLGQEGRAVEEDGTWRPA